MSSEYDAIPTITRNKSYFPLLIQYLDDVLDDGVLLEVKGKYHVVTNPGYIGCGIKFTILATNVRIDNQVSSEPEVSSSKEDAEDAKDLGHSPKSID